MTANPPQRKAKTGPVPTKVGGAGRVGPSVALVSPFKITAVTYISAEMLDDWTSPPPQPRLSWWQRVVLRRKPMTPEEWAAHARSMDELWREMVEKMSEAIAREEDARVYHATHPEADQ